MSFLKFNRVKPMSLNRVWIARVVVAFVIITGVPALTILWFTVQTGRLPEAFDERMPQIPPPNTAETLRLAMDSTPVTSTARYSGTLEMVIEGVGQVSPTVFHDAFFGYNQLGQRIDLEHPLPARAILYVNEQPLAASQPNPFHVYTVSVEVGEEAQPLVLQLREDFPADNVGALNVYVVTAGE